MMKMKMLTCVEHGKGLVLVITYLVIDTCLNKVGFTTKSGLRWSFRGGEDKKPRGIGTTCSLLENAQSYLSKRKKKTKRKSQARGI